MFWLAASVFVRRQSAPIRFETHSMLAVYLTRHERLARRALGALIVWHLAYVSLTNIWGLFPSLPPEVVRYEMGEDLDHQSLRGRGALATAMDRWGELTGLWQSWALFAPNVPHTSAFLAVELEWNSDRCCGAQAPFDPSAVAPATTVKLLSKFEPQDLSCYWNPAWSDVRLYNYEWRLAVSASVFDLPAGETFSIEHRQVQRELLTQLVRRESKQFLAFLRMRVHDFLAEHPGAASPDAVVLLGRTCSPAAVGQRPWGWQPCVETPLVRWRPAAAGPTDASTLEFYDPTLERFIPVSALDLPQVASR